MNIKKIRKDFPILNKRNPVVYFDNACMSLKPIQVIEKMNEYYNEYPACGQRSMHRLGKRVTEEVEKSRNIAKKFFNARKSEEIVFTKNTTESINLVAHSLDLKKGDIVITTDKEHNSNLLPWHILRNKGVKHRIVKFGDIEEFKKRMNKNVKLVSMCHTSNLDGTSIPEKEIIKIAHDFGALVMLDAAQSAPHREIDVKGLDVDFLACSGHKMLGPNGIGILYAKYDLLDEMKPFIVGGDTVIDTTYESARLENPPAKFEAGLQNYSGIIGFGEALKYLMKIGRKNIERHETRLNDIITKELENDVEIIGPRDSKLRSGIFSFNIKGIDAHEIAIMLDQVNIAIRSGMHCVHSWFNARGINGSARVSLYLYNTETEVGVFVEEVKKIIKLVK